MIPIEIPIDTKDLPVPVLEIARRAIDGTVPPIVIDYTNNRIIFKGVAAAATPSDVEVSSGDLKISKAGTGVILSNRAGTRYYRLLVENDGALTLDPL